MNITDNDMQTRASNDLSEAKECLYRGDYKGAIHALKLAHVKLEILQEKADQ